MKYSLCLFLLLAALGAGVSASAFDVRLGTNVPSSPSGVGSVTPSGSIAHIDCIFQHLEATPRIKHMPWRRARQEVLSGRLDGFFTAMLSPGNDPHARLSAPLVLENWYWFWRQGQEPPNLADPKLRVGAIMGSHQEAWFEQANHPVTLSVNNLEQLLKLMLSFRIDAFVADREQLEEVAKALAIDTQSYAYRFFRYVPLSAYFSGTFIQSQPQFLDEFNRYVYACAPSGFSLSSYEKDRIAEWLEPRLETWLALPLIYEVLEEQNREHRNITLAEIRERDKKWRQAFLRNDYESVKALEHPELSDYVAGLAAGSDGFITEIIVMDDQGMNAAVSPMTSDYWQGDEAKYQMVFGGPPGELVFEDVLYDESTRRFQVQVGLPLYHPESGTSLGVITLGVDVEQALEVR